MEIDIHKQGREKNRRILGFQQTIYGKLKAMSTTQKICGNVVENQQIPCGKNLFYLLFFLTRNILDHLVHLNAEQGILLVFGVHEVKGGVDGGVIPIEDLRNAGIGHIGDLSNEKDRKVTGSGDLLVPLGTEKIGFCDLVLVLYRVEDFIHRNVHGLGSS